MGGVIGRQDGNGGAAHSRSLAIADLLVADDLLPLTSCHRNPGGMQPRAPTRQCQPSLRPWLQPGGLNAGPRTCALAVNAVRVRAVAARPGLWTPTCPPTWARPMVPTPVRWASALPMAATDNPAAASTTIRILRMEHLRCSKEARHGRCMVASASFPMLPFSVLPMHQDAVSSSIGRIRHPHPA